MGLPDALPSPVLEPSELELAVPESSLPDVELLPDVPLMPRESVPPELSVLPTSRESVPVMPDKLMPEDLLPDALLKPEDPLPSRRLLTLRESVPSELDALLMPEELDLLTPEE